jgi:hypothetical protein
MIAEFSLGSLRRFPGLSADPTEKLICQLLMPTSRNDPSMSGSRIPLRKVSYNRNHGGTLKEHSEAGSGSVELIVGLWHRRYPYEQA